jgi:hypothetical protein
MYCIVKSVYNNGAKNYYLIVAKEKIPRIEKLKTYKSIVHADEVYPVSVLTISCGKEDSLWKEFAMQVPENVWMSMEEFEKLIGAFTESIRQMMVGVLHRKIEDNPVPDKPKGREKTKYPKVIYYHGYGPYKSMIVSSLKKKAKESYTTSRSEVYMFSKSFAIDEDYRMVLLPYDVNEIDTDRLMQYKWDVINAVECVTKSPEYGQLPDNIRSVIDYVNLLVHALE